MTIIQITSPGAPQSGGFANKPRPAQFQSSIIQLAAFLQLVSLFPSAGLFCARDPDGSLARSLKGGKQNTNKDEGQAREAAIAVAWHLHAHLHGHALFMSIPLYHRPVRYFFFSPTPWKC